MKHIHNHNYCRYYNRCIKDTTTYLLERVVLSLGLLAMRKGVIISVTMMIYFWGGTFLLWLQPSHSLLLGLHNPSVITLMRNDAIMNIINTMRITYRLCGWWGWWCRGGRARWWRREARTKPPSSPSSPFNKGTQGAVKISIFLSKSIPLKST